MEEDIPFNGQGKSTCSFEEGFKSYMYEKARGKEMVVDTLISGDDFINVSGTVSKDKALKPKLNRTESTNLPFRLEHSGSRELSNTIETRINPKRTLTHPSSTPESAKFLERSNTSESRLNQECTSRELCNTSESRLDQKSTSRGPSYTSDVHSVASDLKEGAVISPR